MDWVVFSFVTGLGIIFGLLLIGAINGIKCYRQICAYKKTWEECHKNSTNHSDCLERLEFKIDEMRLQLGIINARMGDMTKVITIPPSEAPKKLPYTGAKRGRKPKDKHPAAPDQP